MVDTSQRNVHHLRCKRKVRLPIAHYRIVLLHTIREDVEIAVNTTQDAEEQYADDANGDGSARITVALESGNGILARIDVHCLHNEEIVVE